MNAKKIYNSTITCPVCEQPFFAPKVPFGSYRIISRDSDFAINYDGVNPIFYEIFVCEHCGYAEYQNHFATISPKDKQIIITQIAPHWKHKSYSGDRTLDQALETFKLALYNQQLCKAKSSLIAKTCLRIAWLYRWKKDSREAEFLKFALEYYIDAYQSENFPFEKLDEPHCTYLIAELNRKIGNLEDAAKWFGILFNCPAACQNRSLWNMAYDQYQIIKDLKKKS
jgi:uncharacterized protein (DUF2225 family)